MDTSFFVVVVCISMNATACPVESANGGCTSVLGILYTLTDTFLSFYPSGKELKPVSPPVFLAPLPSHDGCLWHNQLALLPKRH